MAIAERLELGPDDFAFYFESNNGVEANALADFLKRAASVAKRHYGELRVVAIRDGSLAVVVKALKKSTIVTNAKKEFVTKPIDTTAKVSSLVAAIVGAVIYAMSPEKGGDTPLAKAGASIVENHSVTSISVVTNNTTTVVMNQSIAARLREVEESGRSAIPAPRTQIERLSPGVEELLEDARQGSLIGETVLVNGELHFRPDGFRYLVPIDQRASDAAAKLPPGARVRVTGHIETLDGQPDRLVIHSAAPSPE